eukprot:COSAG02_NODE_14455_length_1270_cov_1.096499_1_plen_292_part_01
MVALFVMAMAMEGEVRHSGWLWRSAGFWHFEHRYWAELRASAPGGAEEGGERLVFFACEAPEELEEEQLCWHKERGLELARCYKGQAGDDSEPGMLRFSVRAPHLPTGYVQLRCATLGEREAWVDALNKILSEEPEPQPEPQQSQWQQETGQDRSPFAFKLPGAAAPSGTLPAFSFSPPAAQHPARPALPGEPRPTFTFGNSRASEAAAAAVGRQAATKDDLPPLPASAYGRSQPVACGGAPPFQFGSPVDAKADPSAGATVAPPAPPSGFMFTPPTSTARSASSVAAGGPG